MLEGKHVILRLFRESDLEEFIALQNRCTERGEYYPLGLQSPAAAARDMKEGGWWEEHTGRMLITDKQGRLLGSIFFFKGAPYQDGYEVGYTIFRRADRGRGIMSEALPLFSAYLFEAKPIGRLFLFAATENAGSRRVAEKAGYHQDGTLRQAFFLRGRFHDCAVYSMLRSECRPLAEFLQPPGDGAVETGASR
ncbi:MAG: GNAT family protein [Phycisphaerae bacterium]|jgi:RimJ/RimL family protein N-acetyltransferase